MQTERSERPQRSQLCNTVIGDLAVVLDVKPLKARQSREMHKLFVIDPCIAKPNCVD
jgi:hypothetical protein